MGADQNWVLSVGSMAFDSIKTESASVERVLGGAVNYFSVAASLLSRVEIIAVVGDDFPEKHLEWLRARGIGTSGVERKPGKTFCWAGEYDSTFLEAKTLDTQLNVFRDFQPKLSIDHLGAPYLFLANIDPTLQLQVLEQTRDHRLTAADTMNFWIKGSRDTLKKVLAQVDVLCINEGEARLLSGCHNLLEATEAVRAMGPKVLVVKRGEYGAWVISPTSMILVPAFPVREVVDPTGAGDSFAGGFVGSLAEQGVTRHLLHEDPKAWDRSLRQAALSGCAMASFTVEKFSLSGLAEIDRNAFHHRRQTLAQMANLG